jgi:TolA-binding protein
MKTISCWICLFTLIALSTPRARAQDAATQQQLDGLSARIDELGKMLNEQDTRISALEKKISDMEDKLNQPSGNNYASADDLKNLAEQVQEIDRKRQEDNQKILDALKTLGKSGGFRRPPPDNSPPAINPGPNSPNPTPISNQGGTQPGPGGSQQGYWYTIQPGNTLTAISKAYRAQGVKVSVDDILKANPGLNPNSLIVGKKIWIPAPQ